MGEINYDVYETPHVEGRKTTYHVRVTNSELIDFEAVKRHIAESSTASTGDVALVVEQLSKFIAKEIGKGNRVHIDGIGYFSIGIETDATDEAKTINATRVRVRGPKYRPDKTLCRELTDISFVRTPMKKHSALTTDSERQYILKDYFSSHPVINRAEFQQLLGMTKEKALRILREYCQQPDAVLIKDGSRNSPYYLPNYSSPFWK